MSERMRSLISKAVVDLELRKQIFDDPAAVAAAHGLNDREALLLSSMRGRMSQFLGSLDVKVSRMSSMIYCT